MRIGIPKEIKVLEGRVGLIPAAAAELVRQGHEVFVEQSAGVLSSYSDDNYRAVGVKISPDADALYDKAQMIVKVKEPQEEEIARLRSDHILFSYLHLAAETQLAQWLLDVGLLAIAFETVEDANGRLPLLAPMSDIAGRIAVQAGGHYLHSPLGGKGLLLGGLPAAERGKVVILGGGVVGGNAAIIAAGLGAEVIVFDRNRDKLAAMRALGPNVTGLFPFDDLIKKAVIDADLLVGAVLVTGELAPHIVTAETVQQMEPGSVIVDVSVDQGGCIETTKPTTYAAPTFDWHGVVHFAVTNMPGAVPKTASQALSASLMDYVSALAQPNWRDNPELVAGINLESSKIIHPGLKKSLNLP